MFRYAVMGAGSISRKFCDAVRQIDDSMVTAVSSKSMERAEQFAHDTGVEHIYDNYEQMLVTEKPDCVYIGVTQNAHYELTMLCLDHNVPVLCEKAMFMNSQHAETVFRRSREQQVFVMEALWSRFLPAVRKAKQWIDEGRIGEIRHSQASIGFCAPEGRDNHYHNPALGGGTSFDITVYAYELTTYLVDLPIEEIQVSAVWGDTGVDLANQITLRYPNALSSLSTSFQVPLSGPLAVYGTLGYILLPFPHIASEVFLYNNSRELVEHFQDEETRNGFVYEIREVMDCIRSGQIESKVVPHQVTLDCARLFDKIESTRR